MAVGVITRFPDGAGSDMYDAVNAKLQEAGDSPPGLIFQSSGELEGRFQVFAVWESAEDGERFLEERLIPAIKAVVGDEAFAALPDAERVHVDVHDYIIP